jgi:hypothetical protein
MNINCNGRIDVPTPGTPVPLSTDPTSPGKMYIGTQY